MIAAVMTSLAYKLVSTETWNLSAVSSTIGIFISAIIVHVTLAAPQRPSIDARSVNCNATMSLMEVLRKPLRTDIVIAAHAIA